jgi:TRAP-type C4-dicarboxylate transport system permease small subunit
MIAPADGPDAPIWQVYARFVRGLVYAFVAVGGVAVILMVAVTCAEVILRIFSVSLTGVYDVVKLTGGISMAGALPYTTACKGHVAIEYFFQKLSRRGRIIVDAISRLIVLALFIFLAVQSLSYGHELHRAGQVSLTLKIPDFWLAYFLAGSCFLVCLIKIYHLFHPGRELIRP